MIEQVDESAHLAPLGLGRHDTNNALYVPPRNEISRYIYAELSGFNVLSVRDHLQKLSVISYINEQSTLLR